MRFNEENTFTANLNEGISPQMNFDTFSSSLETTFIFFLNEDVNYLIVRKL